MNLLNSLNYFYILTNELSSKPIIVCVFRYRRKIFEFKIYGNKIVRKKDTILKFNLPSLATKFVFACSKQKSGEWKLSTNVDSTFSSELLSLANSKIDEDGFCATCNQNVWTKHCNDYTDPQIFVLNKVFAAFLNTETYSQMM